MPLNSKISWTYLNPKDWIPNREFQTLKLKYYMHTHKPWKQITCTLTKGLNKCTLHACKALKYEPLTWPLESHASLGLVLRTAWATKCWKLLLLTHTRLLPTFMSPSSIPLSHLTSFLISFGWLEGEWQTVSGKMSVIMGLGGSTLLMAVQSTNSKFWISLNNKT